MTHSRGLAILALSFCATACSGSGSDGETGGGGGASGSGGGSAGRGSAGASACEDTAKHVDVSIEPIDYDANGDWEATGRVVESTSNHFVIDSCNPAADGCAPMLTTITVTADALDVVLPQNALVRAHFHREVSSTGAMDQFSVRNVPNWDGTTNPIFPDERWYLLTSEGTLQHVDGPFTMQYVQSACMSTLGVDAFTYDVVVNEADGGPKTVSVSESATLTHGGRTWSIRVIRAFALNLVDGTAPFSWWAVSD